jgi:diadenosine tetraphosphate (Ap4A) HIT family hydrolase
MKDVFREAWKKPEKFFALYVDDTNGFMVIPDAQPVVRHHILVIPLEATPYQELTPVRQRQIMELANITADHIQKKLKPKRKVGYAIWGNNIKTAHIHLLPRNLPEDGAMFFTGDRPWANQEQLKATQKLLMFPPNLQSEAQKRVTALGEKQD